MMTKEERKVYNAAWREERPGYFADYYADHKDERRVSQRAYNAAHKEEVRDSQHAYRVAHRDELREMARAKHAEFTEWLQVLRAVNGCEDCETHEGTLLHHHVDPSTKRFNLAHMAKCSLDALEEELEKCVVLCASCHTKRHAEMRALAA